MIVREDRRRRGLGRALTRARMDWLADRCDVVRYFANEHNLTSIALHDALGFSEVARDVLAPGVTFEGGVGLLFERRLG